MAKKQKLETDLEMDVEDVFIVYRNSSNRAIKMMEDSLFEMNGYMGYISKAVLLQNITKGAVYDLLIWEILERKERTSEYQKYSASDKQSGEEGQKSRFLGSRTKHKFTALKYDTRQNLQYLEVISPFLDTSTMTGTL